MPITPFLHGQAFDSELIAAMGKALDATCEALGLSDRGDRTNELIAQKIIELAQRGLRNGGYLLRFFDGKYGKLTSAEATAVDNDSVYMVFLAKLRGKARRRRPF